MDELITWLRAMLDAREAYLRRCIMLAEPSPLPYEELLAEVEAKRRVLDECERTLEFEDYGHWIAEQVIKALAQPYAGREGWREEWRA